MSVKRICQRNVDLAELGESVQVVAERMRQRIEALLALVHIDNAAAEFRLINLTTVLEEVLADLHSQFDHSLGGRRKNAVALTAFRAIKTNSLSRQIAIPLRRVTIIVSRPRK